MYHTWGGGYKHKVSVGKHERKRPLGKPRLKWENTRMDLKGTRSECEEWIYMAQDR